jgi:hypothetical protein
MFFYLAIQTSKMPKNKQITRSAPAKTLSKLLVLYVNIKTNCKLL